MQNYYGNNFGNETSVGARTGSLSQASANAFMTRVFAIMGIGLVITGLTAFGVSQVPELISAIFGTGLRWVVMLAPIAFILAFSFGIEKMSYTTASVVFGLFSLTMGLSLSSIFLRYTSSSIASTFFISAGMFGAMAFIGATTKRDLTSMKSILMMALIGVIIAMFVNILLASSTISWILNILIVIIFSGLTAYHVQQLLDMSHAEDGSEWAKKASLLGALRLYMSFINMFLALLRLFGSSRD